MEFIKHRVENTDHLLFGVLMIDEMAIRQKIEFDGQKFCGYCDINNTIANEEHNIAKEALVFLVVGINESWKIAVEYFFINGINGEQKANLILQCLSMLHDCGFCIKSLTCDCAANNLSMIRFLKCNINNPEYLQTHFEHPISKHKVHVFLDPCHMLKLIRNTLGDYKCIVNKNGGDIKWDYIVALHELQENEGFGKQIAERTHRIPKKKK